MAVGKQNTMVEGLQAMLGHIAQLKTTPDADLEYLIGLETQVLGKLRAPIDQINQQQQQGGMPGATPMPGAGPQMGGMPGGMPGAMPGGPQMMPGGGAPIPGIVGGGVPGVMTGPGLPNPDELRRMLGTKMVRKLDTGIVNG